MTHRARQKIWSAVFTHRGKSWFVMATTFSRVITTGALVLWACAGIADAQTPTSLVNALELERLMASDVPADHATASAHFVALADRYTAEAAVHEQMAQSYRSNPTPKLSKDISAHCEKLAKLNREAARTVRTLAEHHQKVATGVPSSAPTAADRLAAAAPTPTLQELKTLAATATSPADHAALSRYYRSLQTRYTADAKEHTRLAMYYHGTKAKADAAHCERLSRLSRDAAVEAGIVADMHTGMTTPRGTASGSLRLDEPRLAGTGAPAIPADHAAVAAGFRAAQATAWSEFTSHSRLASYYRSAKLVGEAVHCEREARVAKLASDAAGGAATLHEEMRESSKHDR